MKITELKKSKCNVIPKGKLLQKWLDKQDPDSVYKNRELIDLSGIEVSNLSGALSSHYQYRFIQHNLYGKPAAMWRLHVELEETYKGPYKPTKADLKWKKERTEQRIQEQKAAVDAIRREDFYHED